MCDDDITLLFARVVARSFTIQDAWQQVRDWLACEPVWILQPTERHSDILGELLALPAVQNLVTDAHLGALAIEHGLTLCSIDGDFARFSGLSWRNPLAT
jgi:predicted nucleic acid-binding protein